MPLPPWLVVDNQFSQPYRQFLRRHWVDSVVANQFGLLPHFWRGIIRETQLYFPAPQEYDHFDWDSSEQIFVEVSMDCLDFSYY
jgi:hypothetical protein